MVHWSVVLLCSNTAWVKGAVSLHESLYSSCVVSLGLHRPTPPILAGSVRISHSFSFNQFRVCCYCRGQRVSGSIFQWLHDVINLSGGLENISRLVKNLMCDATEGSMGLCIGNEGKFP